ncbi:twin-arginine translocation signal domain-containing protein [Natrialbaceae archaeon A-gly3]
MARDDSISRRTVMKLAGAATATAALAGCTGDSDDDDNGDDNGDDAPDVDWSEVDEIYLEGHSTGWIGIEPEGIAGETNPTLELIEGETYDFRWVNEDGSGHNIEIWDADGDVVDDDYETEEMAEQGEEQTLEDVEITSDMEEYACAYHPTAQVGPIDVQEPEDDEENDDEEENGDDNGDEENDE